MRNQFFDAALRALVPPQAIPRETIEDQWAREMDRMLLNTTTTNTEPARTDQLLDGAAQRRLLELTQVNDLDTTILNIGDEVTMNNRRYIVNHAALDHQVLRADPTAGMMWHDVTDRVYLHGELVRPPTHRVITELGFRHVVEHMEQLLREGVTPADLLKAANLVCLQHQERQAYGHADAMDRNR